MVGPTLFLPSSTVWQALHLLKTLSPLAASPWASAGLVNAIAPVRARIEKKLTARILTLRFCLSARRCDPRLPHLNWHSPDDSGIRPRSEEHTSELQSLMRISYAVFFLKKKNKTQDKSK